MRRATIGVMLLLSLVAHSSPQDFEVASLKLVSGRSGEAALFRMETNDTRVSYSNASLDLLISLAYRISDKRISGIPGALESAFYDVSANLPPNAIKEQVPAMLQRLLADRLKLAVRHQTETVSAYDLVVAPKGPRLTPAKPGSAGLNQIIPGQIILTGRNLESICDILGRVVGRPVVNKTALDGEYDFTLGWGPDETGPSIFTTLQEQQGLKLVPSKAPVDTLVVTHVERIPTDN